MAVSDACPRLHSYTDAERVEAADTLATLPAGGIIPRMIADYGVVRNETRVCRGEKPT